MNYHVLLVGAGPSAIAADTGQMDTRYGARVEYLCWFGKAIQICVNTAILKALPSRICSR
jgi:hypothetical protein